MTDTAHTIARFSGNLAQGSGGIPRLLVSRFAAHNLPYANQTFGGATAVSTGLHKAELCAASGFRVTDAGVRASGFGPRARPPASRRRAQRSAALHFRREEIAPLPVPGAVSEKTITRKKYA